MSETQVVQQWHRHGDEWWLCWLTFRFWDEDGKRHGIWHHATDRERLAALAPSRETET